MKVELVDSMGSDLSVVNAARVSFAKESDWQYERYGGLYECSREVLSEKDQKLINYLAKHGHWTPFAHAFLSFRIKAPIFVARQLVKHQVGLAWNEVSRRYVDDEPEFWFPEGWRQRPEGNVKQGSSNRPLTSDENYFANFADIPIPPKEVIALCLDLYGDMIHKGVAPEQARMILPQNTMTEWIWSGSLAAFARVCKLRLDPHAQQETQDIAKQINGLVPETFKHSWKALLD